MSGFSQTSGFVPLTYQDIVSQLNTAFLQNLDNALDISSDQPVGQLIAILANREASLWELLQVAYQAFDRNQAEFYLLDALGYLTGTIRNPYTYSYAAAVQVNLNAGVTLPAGSMASVAGHPEITFASVTGAYNGATSGATVTVDFQCTQPGPFAAPAGTLNVIAVPYTGWNSVDNVTDAALGAYTETDAAYRVRQVAELSRGGSNADAIRTALLSYLGTVVPNSSYQVNVLENTANVTVNGMPANSFQAVIYDGTPPLASNNAIAQTIWNVKPAGVLSYGVTAGTAIDGLGNDQLIYFSRATVTPVYMTANISVNGNFPPGGTALVNAAIVNQGLNQVEGVPVVVNQYVAAIMGVQGVVDVNSFYLGTSPGPTGTTNLTMGTLQLASVQAENVIVNTVYNPLG